MKIRSLFTAIIACTFLLLAAAPVPYGIGDTVSDFKLKNVDGKVISLSDYSRSKGVILIFDCNTCPYSKAYNDRIIALDKTYAQKGFPVITINSNRGQGESFQDMVARAEAKNYSFPYLKDETQNVARAFGATNTPHVFLLRREADEFAVAYIGAIDNHSRNGSLADRKYVEEAVNAILAGKPVTTEKTKAVGCGIRYED